MTTFEQLKQDRALLPHSLTLTTFKGQQLNIPTTSDAVSGIRVCGNSAFGLTFAGREEVMVYGDTLYRHGWGQLYLAVYNGTMNETDKAAALEAVDALQAEDFFQEALGLVKFVQSLDPNLPRMKVVDAAMDYVADIHDCSMGFFTARQIVLSVL